MKKLFWVVVLACSQWFGRGLVFASEAVDVMGLYQGDDTFLEFRLMDFTRYIALEGRFGNHRKAILSQVYLSVDDYLSIFEAEQPNQLTVSHSGFTTILRSELLGNGRARKVLIDQDWTESESGVKTTETHVEVVFDEGKTLQIKASGRSLKAVQVGPWEIPTIWTQDFQAELSLPRVKRGLGLYGDNVGHPLGRIVSIDRMRKALAGDPNSSLNQVTTEHLISLCELECR